VLGRKNNKLMIGKSYLFRKLKMIFIILLLISKVVKKLSRLKLKIKIFKKMIMFILVLKKIPICLMLKLIN
jgi:hypothetical protein